MINLTEKEIKIVRKILKKYLPNAKVMVFGSRISSLIKPHSDLDLAIDNTSRIPFSILAAIEDEFEQSELKFRIDIHDWNVLDKDFQSVVQSKHELL